MGAYEQRGYEKHVPAAKHSLVLWAPYSQTHPELLFPGSFLTMLVEVDWASQEVDLE